MHYIPPPPFPYGDVEPGDCQFCNETIFKKNGKINLRSDWHKECITEYTLIYDPKETRKAVWDRDRGTCAECKTRCGLKGWEINYIDPLEDADDDLTYWQLENIETLCWQCHKRVPGSPAQVRAQLRDEQKAHMKKSGSRPKKGRTKPR